MGSKDGFVELGFTYELDVRGRSVFVCQGAMLGTSGMTPERFELVKFGLLGSFSAPAFGTFYILDGATYAELEQIETRSSLEGVDILGNVTFWV